MRENRPSGSEGGATVIPSSLPLSFIWSLRDRIHGKTEVICPDSPFHPKHSAPNSKREFVYWQGIGF
jgi:hypothetical protein